MIEPSCNVDITEDNENEVKLSLSTTPCKLVVSRIIDYAFLCRYLMEVDGHFHAPAALFPGGGGRSPGTHWIEDWIKNTDMNKNKNF
jgi:hypothetical protein